MRTRFVPGRGHLSRKLSSTACTTNGAGAVDREGLELMLRKLEVVDLDSVSRVSDSKVRELAREARSAAVVGGARFACFAQKLLLRDQVVETGLRRKPFGMRTYVRLSHCF